MLHVCGEMLAHEGSNVAAQACIAQHDHKLEVEEQS
jgi:hypothetical protein